MKNIRGALFVLSLSIILLFNSTTIAQSKAPTIWVCSPTSSSYTLIKFRSLKIVNDRYYGRSDYWIHPYTPEEKKGWETKILNEKNCKNKIEKQSYKRLYGKLRDDFKNKDTGRPSKKLSFSWRSYEYLEKKIGKDTLAKLSKKYNEYPLKNLASATQTQQVAKKKPKKKEQTQTQQVAKIDKTIKSLSLVKKEEEKKITIDEVVALGTYQEFESYPEGMLKEFGNCKKQFCRGRIAGKKVYEIFVRRGQLWHERYPGDMIHGMAWFEIMYLEKLRKTQKQIERYTKNGPDGYPNDFKKQKDVNALHALSKTNKGRIKMREALGLGAKDDLATVLRSHWLLGDFLNNDTYKIKKVRLNKDLKKRKKLLEKYQASLRKYKEKLEKVN